MDNKVLIVSNKISNLVNAIVSYMETEKIDYIITDTCLEISKDVKKVIWMNENIDFTIFKKHKNISLVMISDKKNIINENININYIITNLINDESAYNDEQKEYLFKKGIYSIFLEKLGELLENTNNYDGMIYDLTELKTVPDNWIFDFESITDTYNWLFRKSQRIPKNFIIKVINFYDDKIYNDSLREIDYLTEKLSEIKAGKKMIDIFICNKNELNILKNNYFFKLLVKNISPTYKFYIVDKDNLYKKDKDMILKLQDGIIIYNDCVYRDTYWNEFSLGYVNCNESAIEEYNKYFDDIISKYGIEIKSRSDLNEI